MKPIFANRKTLFVERQLARHSANGLVRVDQRFTAPFRHESVLVSGDQWIFAIAHVRSGTVRFSTEGSCIIAPPVFAMYLPPCTVIRIEFDQCILDSTGFLARDLLPNATKLGACIFVPPADQLPTSLENIEAMIVQANARVNIGILGASNLNVARAKKILDRREGNHEDIPSISCLAMELGISREDLSRNFKSVYGLSPLQYRLHVRVMNAVMRLALGEAILGVALDVGFRDLGRFYKQFVKIAAATPKIYNLVKSQNAKTSGFTER